MHSKAIKQRKIIFILRFLVVIHGISRIESEEEVTSVLINIFGGITRCDLVAKGIVEATKGKVLKWPLIVRLDGTNSKEGLEILSKNANEKIIISESMDDAAKAAVEGGK